MRVYSTEIQANKSEALVDDRSIYVHRRYIVDVLCTYIDLSSTSAELFACLPILSILCPVVGIYKPGRSI